MLKLAILTLPKGARFTNKEMVLFLLPVIFEQLMMAALGMADTFMVSQKLGATALAGVALVNRIDVFAKQFFLAFAQGGSVVLAQYIGARNEKYSRISLKTNIQILVFIGILVMLVMQIFKKQFVYLFFGNAEQAVLNVSLKYFSVTALSYPFVALYYACGSLFRVMGESKTPFISSVVMMGLNLVFKYIFIFCMESGVEGAAFSTLLAMAIVGLVLLFRLTGKNNSVRLTRLFEPEFDIKTAIKVLKVSFPNGMEQGLFQFGALFLAGVVSGLGEDAVNADQIARNLSQFLVSYSAAFCALMLMVTGQCLGAGSPEEAQMYKKHILKINYIFSIGMGLIFLIVLKPVVSIFNVSLETKIWAQQILILYTFGTMILYPSSFTVPSALRGAGDTRFVMIVSALSMLIFRLSVAHVAVKVFKTGVMSIWIAMVLDWVVRTVIFEIRYRRGNWKNLCVM